MWPNDIGWRSSVVVVSVILPSDGERANLSLVPKPLATELFYCPACEYEETVPAGQVMAECPKCGLVLAKWQERLREEKQKEDIRRRLLRDARLHEDDAPERSATA